MDKFINATRLIDVLDSAIALPKARGNAKLWCDMAMQYTKRILEEEISAGGEFRRVVHAHWTTEDGTYTDYHNCSSCGNQEIEQSMFCPYCGAIMDEEVK